MKKIARLLAVLFVFSLLGGCGGKAVSSVSAEEAAQTAAASSAAPTEAAAVSEEETSEAEEPEVSVEEPEEIAYFPLEETKSFSYWFSYPPMFDGFADGPMDYLMYTESQKRLNVEIEWNAVSILAANEQFMLMTASNDYADCMMNFTGLYSGGIDEAIENEIILDLTELIETCAPDYNAQRTASEVREKSSLTSSGAQGVMFGFNSVEGRTPATGPVIRQDWLDKLNLDVPQTVDEYHDVLTAFQQELGVASPYGLCSDGVNAPGHLTAAYGIVAPTNHDTNGYAVVDGKLQFGPAQDGFRDYLATMHQWYEEGLISNDFTADNDSAASGIVSNDRIANNEIGIFTANVKNFDNYLDMITEEDAALRGIEWGRLSTSDTLHVGAELDTAAANMGISVSTQAEDPELIVRYFNYFFTEEGDILANYGVEGLSFEYNDQGVPEYTDLVLNNPDGMSLDVAMCLFGGGSTSGPYVVDHSKYAQIYSDVQHQAGESWIANNDGAWNLPNSLTAMMSAEESSEFNGIYNEILTVYQENVLKFIVGDRDLSEFPDYVAQMESMGLEDCTKIAQDAYDRYMSK